MVLGIFFLSDTVLDSAKNVLKPFESKLLVMCERIGEALEIVQDVLHSYRSGAKECAAHQGMGQEPSSTY